MADKWGSFHVWGARLKAAFSALIWDDAAQVFTAWKGVQGAGLVLDPPMASIIEVVGADTYICEAPAGTSATEASWRCQKVSVSGGTTTIAWAGGGGFNQVADNRTELSYS